MHDSLAGVPELINIALVVAFDLALFYFCGIKPLAFLLGGVVLGGGLHPLGGHLIAEHYMFLKVRLLLLPLVVLLLLLLLVAICLPGWQTHALGP